MPVIATIKDLEAIYGRPNEASTVKVATESGVTSGRHVPEPGRASQQYATSFGRNDWATVDHCGKLKRDDQQAFTKGLVGQFA